MTESCLVRLFEHNNWANLQIIRASFALGDDQFDARPGSATTWSVRQTLLHIVESQRGYLSLLTKPPEARLHAPLEFTELEGAASRSGEGLLTLARDESSEQLRDRLRTTDGYFVQPWVVMIQVINHATEHRRQICCTFRALGVSPPDLDGWTYGESTNALVPVST